MKYLIAKIINLLECHDDDHFQLENTRLNSSNAKILISLKLKGTELGWFSHFFDKVPRKLPPSLKEEMP